MTLPDVYLIGAPKAGTTSLARWMAARPDICFSELKEPVYWATDYPALRTFRGFDTREAYEAMFSSPAARHAKVRAEGSTMYLYSRDAVPSIVEAVPDALFIVALRNPAELVVSFHRTQLLLLNESEPDFAVAWQRSLAGPATVPSALDPKLVDYAMVGRLGQAVERLLDVVPRRQVLFVMFDDLVRDQSAVWATLTSFIGVPVEPWPDFAVHNASARTYRFRGLQRLKERPPPVLSGVIRWITHLSRDIQSATIRRLKHRFWWRPESKPEVSPELRAELAEYFAADVATLGAALDVDLSSWTQKYRRAEPGTGAAS